MYLNLEPSPLTLITSVSSSAFPLLFFSFFCLLTSSLKTHHHLFLSHSSRLYASFEYVSVCLSPPFPTHHHFLYSVVDLRKRLDYQALFCHYRLFNSLLSLDHEMFNQFTYSNYETFVLYVNKNLNCGLPCLSHRVRDSSILQPLTRQSRDSILERETEPELRERRRTELFGAQTVHRHTDRTPHRIPFFMRVFIGFSSFCTLYISEGSTMLFELDESTSKDLLIYPIWEKQPIVFVNGHFH